MGISAEPSKNSQIPEILTPHYFKYDNGHGSPKDAFLGTYG